MDLPAVSAAVQEEGRVGAEEGGRGGSSVLGSLWVECALATVGQVSPPVNADGETRDL